MKASTARGNRIALTVLGLLLLAAGGYGLARGYGAYGDAAEEDPVLTPHARDVVTRNGDWLWPVVAVVALIIALLAVRWLLSQLRSGGISELSLPADDLVGRTSVRTGAAASAVEEDVAGYPGVQSASARFDGDDTRPDLQLRVELDDGADVEAVRRQISEHALTRARHALGMPELQAHVKLRFGGAGSRSVA